MPEDLWMARSVPSGSQLALGAIAEAVARPGDLVSSVLTGNGLVAEVRSLAGRTVRRTGSLVQQVMDSAPASPLEPPRALHPLVRRGVGTAPGLRQDRRNAITARSTMSCCPSSAGATALEAVGGRRRSRRVTRCGWCCRCPRVTRRCSGGWMPNLGRWPSEHRIRHRSSCRKTTRRCGWCGGRRSGPIATRIPRAGCRWHPRSFPNWAWCPFRVQLPGAQQYHESSLQRPGDHAQCPDIAQIIAGQKVSNSTRCRHSCSSMRWRSASSNTVAHCCSRSSPTKGCYRTWVRWPMRHRVLR